MGVEANREKLLAGVSCVTSSRLIPADLCPWPVGEVAMSNASLASALGMNPADEISRNILLGLAALREAVTDSGLTDTMLRDTAFINGTTVGGMDITEKHYAEWMQGNYQNISLIHQHEAGATTCAMAENLGISGTLATVSTACSSALNAVQTGADMLLAGRCERAIVGGTEALTLFHLNGFASLGILSNQLCKPFAEDRDGINLGEGAAYLVIENETDALTRGAHIYGYLAGYANRCDAYHQTASSPKGIGATLAMEAALGMAQLKPEEIQYINAHGTATPNNDASELAAIRQVFGDTTPFFESTKTLTGHTTSASGSIEAVFCLMLMRERGYKCVMSNAFGFGGNDSSVILSASPAELPELSDNDKIITAAQVIVDDDVDYKNYIPLLQARRMSTQMRRLVVAACKALEKAGLERPDAILVGTQWGGMQPSASLLTMLAKGEQAHMSPAQFMQSTHNSPAGVLAMRLGCHGYNSTFSHFAGSLVLAEKAAELCLLSGQAKNVLVCAFDETAPIWQDCLSAAGIPAQDIAIAKVLALQ